MHRSDRIEPCKESQRLSRAASLGTLGTTSSSSFSERQALSDFAFHVCSFLHVTCLSRIAVWSGAYLILKIGTDLFPSGNEKTEGILPQIGHGSAWGHQGGDLLCKTAPGPPSQR